GPFKFSQWQSGTSLKLDRNDAYWDKTLEPKAAHLDLRFISDESTAINALRGGQVDGQYFYTPPSGLQQLKASGATQVILGKSLVFWALVNAAHSGPFADPRVRQALLDATDRGAIAKVVFQDTATPARVLSPPASWGYAQNVFESAYNATPAPNM